jgi:hypothetical protein
MKVEQTEGWDLSEETEILRENLPRCHIVYHKFHMTQHAIKYSTINLFVNSK